jgi:hypothetical protein
MAERDKLLYFKRGFRTYIQAHVRVQDPQTFAEAIQIAESADLSVGITAFLIAMIGIAIRQPITTSSDVNQEIRLIPKKKPGAPCPERATHNLDQKVLNKKKKVTFSDMVEIIPRRSLSKSPSTHDLDQVPSVETAYVDLNMTSKTIFVQHNKKRVVSNNDTVAPQPYASMQEQGKRGHDESLHKEGQ